MDILHDPASSPLRLAWARHHRWVTTAAMASATLGLAPFYPHAHVWKQLLNLAHGTLTQPLDVFDLALHGAPWVALLAGVARLLVTAATLSRAQRA